MHIVDDEQMSERAGDNHDAIIIAEKLIVCPRALISNKAATTTIIIIIIIIIKSTQGRVVNPLRDLVISLDLPVLQLRELINWQVSSLIN
jgi:hypothetical protein